MSLFDIYKAKKLGAGTDSLFAAIAGKKLNNDTWKQGFNKWDEEWESGAISASMGTTSANSNYVRSKNFCPIIPDTAYYRGAEFVKNLGLFWYDESQKYLGVNYYATPQEFTTPAKAHYFKLHYEGTTYENDICINISGEHNGEYVPYDGE